MVTHDHFLAKVELQSNLSSRWRGSFIGRQECSRDRDKIAIYERPVIVLNFFWALMGKRRESNPNGFLFVIAEPVRIRAQTTK